MIPERNAPRIVLRVGRVALKTAATPAPGADPVAEPGRRQLGFRPQIREGDFPDGLAEEAELQRGTGHVLEEVEKHGQARPCARGVVAPERVRR